MGKPGGGRGTKKNAGVGVDFKRAKHRVGKKLPRAQNATDTSFKSRTLSLAEQSVAADKEGQAVTGRNLTLKASSSWSPGRILRWVWPCCWGLG
jgi:pre-rRNA-processing protein IPI1